MCSIPDYNRDIQNNLTLHYQPAEAYAGVLITALGLIDMGTTTIVDISQVSHTPEHSDACVKALQDSGIRAVYAYYRGAGPATQYPRDITRLQRTYFSSKDQLLTLALGTNIDAKLYGLAREVGVPAVLHLNRLSAELIELGRAGLLRPGDEYIHCTQLNDDAWRLIRDSGGHVSLSVEIEMTMGQGLPAIQRRARPRGAAEPLLRPRRHRGAGFLLGHARGLHAAAPAAVPARLRAASRTCRAGCRRRDMLEFATIEGARCANLESKVGTLTPGKEADIVLLAADRISIWPLNNAPGSGDEPHESKPCRDRLDRRQGQEMARQPGRRRRAAGDAHGRGGARRIAAPRRLPDEFAGHAAGMRRAVPQIT